MGVQCGILDETLRTKSRRSWKAFGWRFTNILGELYFTTLKTCEDNSRT